MKETGFTFSETKMAFNKNVYPLFYPKSKLSQTRAGECIIILRSGGY
jgi:hypothetical protein